MTHTHTTIRAATEILDALTTFLAPYRESN